MVEPTRGQDWLLQVNTNTVASPVWTDIGGQRGLSLDRNMDEIDTTDKNNAGHKESLPGLRGWSIDLDGLVEFDNGFAELESVWETNHKRAHIRLVRSDAVTYTGQATMTSLVMDAPLDDAATCSVSFTGAEALVKA